MDFIPEKSILDVDVVEIDADTSNLLKSLDFGDLNGVVVAQHAAGGFVKRGDRSDRKPRGDKKAGDRKPRPQKPEAAAAPAAAL